MGENHTPYLIMTTSAVLILMMTTKEDLMLETDRMELDSICVMTAILKSIIVCLVQTITRQITVMSFALMVSLCHFIDCVLCVLLCSSVAILTCSGNCVTAAEQDRCGTNLVPIICYGTYPTRASCFRRSGYTSEVNSTDYLVGKEYLSNYGLVYTHTLCGC